MKASQMKPKVCTACGQPIPQPEGRLVCSSCGLPIRRGQGGWIHGGDGRPRHKNCDMAAAKPPETMELLTQQ